MIYRGTPKENLRAIGRGLLLGFAPALVVLLLMAQTTGGFPSRPIFQTVTALATETNAKAPITASSALPSVRWIETDRAADEKQWDFASSGAVFSGRTRNDAGSFGAAWLNVSRTGTAVTSVTIPAPFLLTNASIALDLVSGNPRIRKIESDGPAGEQVYDCVQTAGQYTCRTRTDVDGTGATWLTVDRTGTTVDSINLAATAVQANGVAIATTESGTFTASFDVACTTTPTIDYDWNRVGNTVTLYPVGTSGFPCTGDSTSFNMTGTPVPAAIRPATGAESAPQHGYTNNSAATWATMTVASSGAILLNRCATFGSPCTSSGWTAALNRVAPTGMPITYMLGNP